MLKALKTNFEYVNVNKQAMDEIENVIFEKTSSRAGEIPWWAGLYDLQWDNQV